MGIIPEISYTFAWIKPGIPAFRSKLHHSVVYMLKGGTVEGIDRSLT